LDENPGGGDLSYGQLTSMAGPFSDTAFLSPLLCMLIPSLEGTNSCIGNQVSSKYELLYNKVFFNKGTFCSSRFEETTKIIVLMSYVLVIYGLLLMEDIK
jgi:hypothetical protein